MVSHTCDPGAGGRGQRHAAPWGLLASLDCLPSSRQMRHPVSTNKMDSLLVERYLSLTSGLHMCSGTFTPPHMKMHTHTPHTHLQICLRQNSCSECELMTMETVSWGLNIIYRGSCPCHSHTWGYSYKVFMPSQQPSSTLRQRAGLVTPKR